jgi:hypothetical protein
MKRILGGLSRAIALIAVIPGILVWIVGNTAFSLRLIAWYKTGQWNKLAIREFLPSRFIAELSANFQKMEKELYWILNTEIIIFLFGFCLILLVSYLIMNGAAKRCEKNPHIVADRLKNLIGNK